MLLCYYSFFFCSTLTLVHVLKPRDSNLQVECMWEFSDGHKSQQATTPTQMRFVPGTEEIVLMHAIGWVLSA